MIDDAIVATDFSKRPFQLTLNTTRDHIIKAHSVVIASGADSRWLGVPGEWEYRGGGVSSCATCDGFLFRGRSCAVVGGGDTAMEEALFLSRICSDVQLIH